MSKNRRLTDCMKWTTGKWFRALKPEHKLFWFYIHDRCDQSGVWVVDDSELDFFIGFEYDLKELLEVFEGEIIPLDEGKKWWLRNYVILQTESFLWEDSKGAVEKCRVRLLTQHNIYDEYKTSYFKAFPGFDLEKDWEKELANRKAKLSSKIKTNKKYKNNANAK